MPILLSRRRTVRATRAARLATSVAAPAAAFAAAVLAALAAPARGQIATDGTLGAARTLTGPDFTVPASLGRRAGPNLFHSFRTFNLKAGETVDFSGPDSVQRVIARVTGGSASTIDGMLGSSIPGASFYLVNPAGVIFGPNASLAVDGSFAVTTADFLRLADGGRFDARTPADSVLTTAPPVAFGFLSPRPAAITVAGRAATEPDGSDAAPAFLLVGDGRSLSIVGGAVDVSNAQLIAGGGRVNVVGVGPPAAGGAGGEVVLDAEDPHSAVAVNGITQGGDVTIAGGSLVDVGQIDEDGNPSGTAGGIVLHGGAVRVADGAFVGGITVDGPGGDVTVRAEALAVSGGEILAETDGPGAGGRVVVSASSAVNLDAGGIIHTLTFGPGAGGDVSVTAPRVEADGGGVTDPLTGVATEAFADGAGGNLLLATGDLLVSNTAVVQALTFGPGPGGNVAVRAAGGTVVLDGLGAVDFTGVRANTQNDPANELPATGAAGGVSVDAGLFRIVDGGAVASNSFLAGAGPGGPVDVRADRLLIEGGGTDPERATGILAQSGSLSAPAGGPGGPVAVTVAGDVVVRGTGASVLALTFGDSPAGPINLSARDLRLEAGGRVSGSTFAGGDGGDVTITAAGRLSVVGAAGQEFTGIFSRSAPSAGPSAPAGRAGTVSVTADDLRIVGPGVRAGISAESTGAAAANRVEVTARRVHVGRGGALAVAAPNTADRAGDVVVTAARDLTLDRATVTAESGGTGGNIRLTAGDRISVVRSEVTAMAGGDGGRITFDPPVVVLDRSTINGLSGGEPVIVTIDTPNLLMSQSLIRTNTPQNFPQTDLSGAIAALRAAAADTGAQLAPQCGLRLGGDVSSFLVTGRGGAPPEPGGPMPAGFAPEELVPGRFQLAPTPDRAPGR